MLPEVYFLIGPKGSGKTSVAKELAYRTNMEIINFEQFMRDRGLSAEDDGDEEVTLALVSRLIHETTSTRVLLEDFPRTET